MKKIERIPQKIEEIRSGFMVQDGTSNRNANVNGSVTPVEMVFGPPINESWTVSQMVMLIYDDSNVSESAYGAVPTLTNGVDLEIHDSGGILASYTGSYPIQSNNDLLSYGFDVRQNLFDINPRSISAVFKFGAGNGILLDGSKGYKMLLRINDDLTGLVAHWVRMEADRVVQ